MTLNLNGIEIEIPGDATVKVSEDGKKIRIEVPEQEVIERIRVVEVEAEPQQVIYNQPYITYIPPNYTPPLFIPWQPTDTWPTVICTDVTTTTASPLSGVLSGGMTGDGISGGFTSCSNNIVGNTYFVNTTDLDGKNWSYTNNTPMA